MKIPLVTWHVTLRICLRERSYGVANRFLQDADQVSDLAGLHSFPAKLRIKLAIGLS